MGFTFFTQHNSLEIRSSFCRCQSFTPFYCCVVFHDVDAPQFNQFGAIMNKTDMNIYVQVLCKNKFAFLWDKRPSMHLLGCMTVTCLVLGATTRQFSRVAILQSHQQCMRAIQFIPIFTSIWCCSSISAEPLW